MKQKLISLITAVTMVMSFISGFTITASAAVTFDGGTGTEADPYLIADLATLETFRDSVNEGETYADKFITLTADIDLSDVCGANIGEGGTSWTPIGNITNPFKGTFDGDHHKITGLYINASDSDYQSLFGYIDEGGTVTNLGVDGTVTGDSYVGGVVGENYNGTVTNCYNTGTVSGDFYVGGVVGYTDNGTITSCYNTGAVTGTYNRVGGVVGFNNGGTVTNCYSTGAVTGDQVGGVVGYTDNGTITSCYNTGAVSGSGDSYVGGVVGFNNGTVTSCYYDNTVYTAEDTTSGVAGMAAADFAVQANFGWDFSTVWTMSDAHGRPILRSVPEPEPPIFKDGDGSAATPYEIPDLKTLKRFRNDVNNGNTYEDKFVKLTADIVLGGSEENQWTPIGQYTSSTNTKPFKGTFDGGGNSIEGLYINKADSDYQGLFGYIENAAIKSLSVSGSILEKQYIGGICGRSSGSDSGKSVITDCSNSCTITNNSTSSGTADVGGIVGYCTDTEITRCNNTGTINANKGRVGGICGAAWKNITITDCYNTANVTSNNNYCGGIVGYIYSSGTTITRCYNTGDIQSTNRVGGIVGENAKDGTKIINAYNTGSVTSTKIASFGGNGSFVGGIFGSNTNGQFHNCYNIGNVSHLEDEYNKFGAIGGQGGQAYNSYYLSNETVNTDMGGIANLKGSNSTIPVDNEAFASGEIAWHLYNDFDDYYLTAEDVQVWGQTLSGDNADAYPILTTDSAKRVYKVTFATKDNSEYAVRYVNESGVGTLPTSPTPADGYEFYKWSKTNSADGDEFTANTPITEDITVYAVQRKQYGTQSGEHKVETTYGTAATFDLSTCISYGGETPQADDFTYLIVSGNNTLGASIEGNTLTVPDNAPANESGYTLTIRPSERAPQISLMSVNPLDTEAYNFFEVKVIVNKATPTLAEPTTTAVTYGAELSDIALDTGWAWVDGDTVPTVTNSGYTAQYAVPDYANYDWSGIDGYDSDTHTVTCTIAVMVNKANPLYTVPANLTATYGQTLADVALPSGFSWQDTATKSVGNVGTNTFKMTYTPEDTANYNTVSDIEVSITVSEAQPTAAPTTEPTATPTIEPTTEPTVEPTAEPTAAPTVEPTATPTVAPTATPTAKPHHSSSSSRRTTPKPTATPKPTQTPTPEPLETGRPSQTDKPVETIKPNTDWFTDVPENAWYYNSVKYVFENGLMVGVSKTEFAPETDITRAMFVTVLYRMENEPDISNEILGYPFADVDAESWYGNAVYWARLNGIVEGYSDEKFAPEENITRGQMAAIVYRYAKFKGYDTELNGELSYLDNDSISDYAKDAVIWNLDNGIMLGNDDNTFSPASNTTRAQAAAVFERIVENLK